MRPSRLRSTGPSTRSRIGQIAIGEVVAFPFDVELTSWYSGTVICTPFVERLLWCTSFVRRFACAASPTLAWASEQKRLPSTPPRELAVIVKCTRSRCTSSPSNERSSFWIVRLRIGQSRCAESKLRSVLAVATNDCVVEAGAIFAGLPATGVKRVIAVPSATRRDPRRTNLLILSETLAVPISWAPFGADVPRLYAALVPALVVEAAAPRATTAATTDAIARCNRFVRIGPPF